MGANADLRKQSIALVGLMGVGKTTIGRRLAKRLAMPFFDSDDEIEKASQRSVKGLFNDFGEAEFRAGERRVITRLLSSEPIVLATGGGAFIPEETRKIIMENSISIWLKADFKTNMERVNRKRDKRPLLAGDNPEQIMQDLMQERFPIYAKAHLHVNASNCTHAKTVYNVIEALETYLQAHK